MKLPQLHVRDLFWLVLVAGMGCAWGIDRQRQLSRITALETALDANLLSLQKFEEVGSMGSGIGGGPWPGPAGNP
jgi:hypothetical protein